MTSADHHKPEPRDPGDERPLRCEEIQALMLDFLQQALGAGRADLVREHTRRCPVCHARMQTLQKTVGILHDAPLTRGTLPQHLSARHHNRIVRAIMHPVWDWVYIHHIIVSALVAAIIIALVFFGLRHYKVWRAQTDPGIPVVIGGEAGIHPIDKTP